MKSKKTSCSSCKQKEQTLNDIKVQLSKLVNCPFTDFISKNEIKFMLKTYFKSNEVK